VAQPPRRAALAGECQPPGLHRLRGEPRTRLRYLLALFAKEVALRAHGVPGSEEALESLVEILAHAERNLSGSGISDGGGPPAPAGATSCPSRRRCGCRGWPGRSRAC
jgi:hypothetical protein